MLLALLGLIQPSKTSVLEAQAAAADTAVKVPVRPVPIDHELWRTSIAKTPLPAKGCHKAVYPSLVWTTVPCSTTPSKKLHSPIVVGGAPTNDFSAQVPALGSGATTGLILSAQGSFDKVTVTGETNVSADNIATRHSEYELQLNTNTFKSPACELSKNPDCMGWAQFLFSNDPGSPPASLRIQYWLLNFGTCQSPWAQSGQDCHLDSPASDVPVQSIQSLVNLVLTGIAIGNVMDTVILTDPDGNAYATNTDSAISLGNFWTTAEFNVFGDESAHQARFDPGSTLVVRTHVDIGGGPSTQPVAVQQSFTKETNSLDLVQPPCVLGAPFNAITFVETNVAGTNAPCAATPPPNNTCADSQELVAFEQKALANAQKALTTQICEGSARLECVQRIKSIQQLLQLAEAQRTQNCK